MGFAGRGFHCNVGLFSTFRGETLNADDNRLKATVLSRTPDCCEALMKLFWSDLTDTKLRAATDWAMSLKQNVKPSQSTCTWKRCDEVQYPGQAAEIVATPRQNWTAV